MLLITYDPNWKKEEEIWKEKPLDFEEWMCFYLDSIFDLNLELHSNWHIGRNWW